MWFKNLCIFRLTEGFAISPEELDEKLNSLSSRPCGSREASTFGWYPPLGENVSDQSDQLVHAANGFMMICARKEEKIMPASVINELLQKELIEFERSLGRKASTKERIAFKDEIIFATLHKALTRSTNIYAYIDPKGGWLIVDAASSKKAEDLLSLLRNCLGSLPAVPLNTINNPSDVMTGWLKSHDIPNGFFIGCDCELREQGDDQGIVGIKNIELSLPEIENHLDTGKQVTKLAMDWNDSISFVVDDNLAIKRLKFLDLIQEQASEIEAESHAERFDADFSIMSLELANFLPRFIDLFGGENRAT
jgi:recombination associated protein RdgC